MTASHRAGGGRSGWELIRRPGPFRRMWLARFVSLLGDSAGLVALILLVAEKGGRGLDVGILLLAGGGTATLLSPLLGLVADRAGRRRLMIVCELGQAVAVGLIVLADPALPWLTVLFAVQSVLAATFAAAARSAVADLVDDADLDGANAILGAGGYGLEVAGPVVVAVLLPLISARGVLALDALTFLLSPLLLAGLPRLEPDGTAPAPRIGRGTADGLRVLWRDRLVRAVALGFVAVVACNGADDVALVFLGRDSLGLPEAVTGLLYAGSGLGLLAGFIVLARRTSWGAPVALAVAGFAVSSAGNLLTGIAPVFLLAFAAQAVRGAGLSLIDVGTTTLVQRSVPRELRGRAFANLYGGVGLAAAVSYAVGGLLLDHFSPRTLLVLAGAGGIAVAAFVTLAAAGLRGAPAGSDPDL